MSDTPNCQTFSSSTVISYSSLDAGVPKVYQQTSETRTGPGGVRICAVCWNVSKSTVNVVTLKRWCAAPFYIVATQTFQSWVHTEVVLVSHSCFFQQIRETRQSVRDSESGLERLAIGHHIGSRAHIMERSQNRRTGDREERQDFINLDESEWLSVIVSLFRWAGSIKSWPLDSCLTPRNCKTKRLT